MELNQTMHLQRQINREYMRIEKYKTNHIIHLLLSLITAGLWMLVWVLVTVSNANERMKSEKRIEHLELAVSVGEVG